MQRSIHRDRLAQALEARGLSQSALADQVGVSREAVSKWLSGEAFPRPDHLMKVALITELPYEELVRDPVPAGEPVVGFRRKGASKTTLDHVARAKTQGRLLGRLEPFLPEQLTHPPTLLRPLLDYDYVQRVAAGVRSHMGLGECQRVELGHVVDRFAEHAVVLVPVLWGERPDHENALHIHLPVSKRTWVFINLDSRRCDFLFWLVHELGHALAPTSVGDEVEQFCDAFAGAVLFPQACAAAKYSALARSPIAKLIVQLKELAAEFGVSPVTIKLEVDKYASHTGRPPLQLPKDSIYKAASVFGSDLPTVRADLFGEAPCSAADFVHKTEEVFKTPFFRALAAHLGDSSADASFVRALLNTPLLDAKALAAALT